MATAALGLLAALAGCRSAPPPPAGQLGAQPLERTVPRWTGAQWRDGAEHAWRTTLDAARRTGRLDADAAVSARLRAVAQRLAAAASTVHGRPPAAPLAAHVLQSAAPDAWCVWDLGCVATSALLDLAAGDDALAAALAHALAHAVLDHGREGADAIRLGSVLGRAGGSAGSAVPVGPGGQVGSTGQAGSSGSASPASPTAATTPASAADPAGTPYAADASEAAARALTELPWSRVHEIEADRLGVELAARAGFDPRAAIGFWRAALAASPVPGGPPGWVARHPAPGNRTADLAAYAQRVVPLWEGTRGIIRSP